MEIENPQFYDGSLFGIDPKKISQIRRQYPKEFFLQTINVHWRDMDIEEAMPDWLASMEDRDVYSDFMYALDTMIHNPYPSLCQDLHYWGWFEMFHKVDGFFQAHYTVDECIRWLEEFKKKLEIAYDAHYKNGAG